jgi:NAD(P)-dependent dehydrogenase (short-subunit alcohol dehydrogenase family)
MNKEKMTNTTSKPVCVIIGAGPGIGLAVAQKFAAESFAIALIARNADRAKQLAADANLPNAHVYAADASDTLSLQTAMTATTHDLGPIDVVLYNAAALTMATPTALSAEALKADLDVSVVGALTAIQLVVPSMLSRGTGTILFTGGGLALYPSAGVTSLSIGKAAIRSLAFCCAEEVAPDPIRVGMVTVFGAVEPGTPFDPTKIADAFWELHADRDASLGVEIQFKGRPD